MKYLNHHIYLNLMLVLLGASIVLSSQHYKQIKSIAYGAGFFPSIIGVLLIICAILDLTFFLISNSNMKNSNNDKEIKDIEVIVEKKANDKYAFYFFLLWSFSYVFLLNTIGFILITLIGLCVFFYLYTKHIKFSFLLSVAASIFFQLIFANFLSVQLPLGVLSFLSRYLSWTPY